MDEVEKVRKESKLSGLLAQKHKLIDKIIEIEKKEKLVAKELVRLQTKLKGVEDGIRRLEDRPIWITTHALERYRLRVGPPDATEEEIREVILTPFVIKAMDTLGNCNVPLSPDSQIYLAIEDRKIITIINGNDNRN